MCDEILDLIKKKIGEVEQATSGQAF